MTIILQISAIFWFFLFTKILLFWLWLWQLKEYHWGRFKAHFESQRFKKIFSGFWRLKYPKLTKKILVILACGIFLELLMFFYFFKLSSLAYYFLLLVSLLFSPVFVALLVFIFQIPTVILRKGILKKAHKKRKGFKDLVVIGITGSYGKTSTKEFLYVILREKFGDRVLKTQEHINAEIGIAQTILNKLKPEHKFFIAEIGAYERGKIKEVCWMLKPQIGILTGINEQHLATFGSQDNIIKAKFELIESLSEDGVAIFNGSNKKVSNLKLQISNLHLKSKIFCSLEEKMDLWADDIKTEKERISFKAYSKDKDWAQFNLNLIGRQNIENILLAACCAKELGMGLSEIASACQKIKPEQGSTQLKKGVEGLNIIDATYSANPDGVLADLEYLKLWTGKKIIVMPCLIELGKASKEVHQRIGKKIGQICDLAIITTKDRFKELKDGVEQAGMSADNILLIENPNCILVKIKTFTTPGDIILLESRVPKELKSAILEVNMLPIESSSTGRLIL